MALPSWWEVTTPHKDIRRGGLSEAIFAADLADVMQGKAPLEYQDARLFFEKTYPTQGLQNLLRNVLSRLSGKTGDPVIQLQTPFGGGKTHALLAIYHLLKNRKKIEHVYSDLKLLKPNKVRIAAFVGTSEETLKGRTPWGEIAYQLGCYDEMRDHDQSREAPGKKILLKILEKASPAVILIDEIAQYVAKSPPEFATKVLAFTQEITEAMKVAEGCCLVATLPSSAPYGEAGESALRSLQMIFGRTEAVHTPVEGVELYEIIRNRLFEDIGDKKTRRSVAKSYFDLYQKLGSDVPSAVRELEYRDRIERSYPFHPELIDVLYERWGSYPTFQRTRGVLRLLAEVVADLYKKKVHSPLIQSSIVNLGNQTVRREFIKHIGNVFETVIAADIAGENAKAPVIDREMGSEYEKYDLARGIATSVFLYSFSGGEKKGTTIPAVRVALLREGIHSTIVGDVVDKLTDIESGLWYLHQDANLYLFRSQPTLGRVILDREALIEEDRVNEELQNLIQKNAGRALEVYLWPEESSDVPDTRKPKLVVLSPTFRHESEKTEKFARELFNRAGAGLRVYKNALFVAVLDQEQHHLLCRSVKRHLALSEIRQDRSLVETMVEEDQDKVRKEFRDAENQMPFKILTAYRFLGILGRDGVDFKDMGIPTIGTSQTVSDRIRQYLRDKERLLPRVSPKYLLDKAFGKDENEKSAREVHELFLKTPGMSVPETEDVSLQAISEGTKTGMLAVREGDELYFKQEVHPNMDSVVLRGEIAKAIKEQEKTEAEKPSEADVPTGAGREDVVKPPQAPKGVRAVSLRVRVPWDKLASIIGGVIRPLKEKGFPPKITVEIKAESEEGFDRTTLDSKVKETLQQIGAEIEEWEEE